MPLVQCSQCGNNAMFWVGPDDGPVPLCLPCNLKFAQLVAMQAERQERLINYLTGYTEMVGGVEGLLPRFPQRKVIQMSGVTLNNIQVHESQIGVLNTGTIGTVDAAISSLKQTGDEGIGVAIKALTEAVVASTTATAQLKNKAVEILSVIASEATAPKERTRATVVRVLLGELSELLQGAEALDALWRQYGPLLTAFFT